MITRAAIRGLAMLASRQRTLGGGVFFSEAVVHLTENRGVIYTSLEAAVDARLAERLERPDRRLPLKGARMPTEYVLTDYGAQWAAKFWPLAEAAE